LYLETADMSALHAPLAELTLAAIGQALAWVAFVVLAVIIWFRWAFSSGDKAYDS